MLFRFFRFVAARDENFHVLIAFLLFPSARLLAALAWKSSFIMQTQRNEFSSHRYKSWKTGRGVETVIRGRCQKQATGKTRRGVLCASHNFRTRAFVALCARHRSRRGQSTLERPVLSTSACSPRGRRRAQKTSDRASLVLVLLDKPHCDGGRRRNRVLGLRAPAFPLVCGRGGPRGTRRVSPPLWPSVSKKRTWKRVLFPQPVEKHTHSRGGGTRCT